MTAPTIEAKLLWECQNQLGEGILWDSDAKAVRWVDLKVAEIHSLNPETKAYTIDKYPETQFVTAIALRQNKQDLIGLTQDAVAVLPVSTPSSSSATSPKDAKPTEHKIGKIVAQPLTDLTSEGIEMRFNDGGCDPAGRMYAGSTNHSPGADFRGEFWRVEVDGTSSRVFDKIGCSNGLGWSPDHKTMYYIDSAIDKIRAFDYDLATGQLSNEREFQPSPAPLEPGSKTQGCFDGLTMDGVGNVWVARWSDGRVMGFRPDGSLIANIKVPGCRSPTIPCFGGDKLETMFIASAHTKWLRQGDIQPQFPHSGDVFSVDFGPGSEIRKVLGDDWKGAERYRFAA